MIILFRGLFLVKCELGDSAGAWWQFPNKDKYNQGAISFRGKKKLIRLTKGSACAFSSNWQKQEINLTVLSRQLLGFCSVPAN